MISHGSMMWRSVILFTILFSGMDLNPVMAQQSKDLTVTPKVQTSSGNLYAQSWAVLVGVNKFASVDIPTLHYAENDVTAVRNVLLNVGFPTQNIFTLTNTEATRDGIQRVLSSTLKRVTGPNDRVFVFFSTHGVTQSLGSGGEEGFLLPYDADPTDLAYTALSMQDLKRIGKRWKAKHVLMAIDACFSGYSLVRAQPTAPSDKRYWELLTKSRAIQVITAGTKEQPVLEEDGYGVFTAKLIEGLQGHADQNRDGMIPLMELAGWMHKRVAQASDYKQDLQYGNLDGNGQFVFTLPTKSLAYQDPFAGEGNAKGSWIGSIMHLFHKERISSIVKGSPAELAGLKIGDVPQKVNQQAIKSDKELAAVLSNLNPGRRVSLTINRKGNIIRLPLWPMGLTQARDFLQRNCHKDDAESCAELGSFFVTGKGGVRNAAMSIKFFQKACDLDSWLGCFALGSKYSESSAFSKKEAESYRFLKKSCDLAPSQACVMAGLYVWGKHTDSPVEVKKALTLGEKGCRGGDAFSCFYLSTYFQSLAMDNNQAMVFQKQYVKVLRKDCEEGYYMSCALLGTEYAKTDGLAGPGQDLKKSQHYFVKACKLGGGDSCEVAQKLEKAKEDKFSKAKK